MFIFILFLKISKKFLFSKIKRKQKEVYKIKYKVQINSYYIVSIDVVELRKRNIRALLCK